MIFIDNFIPQNYMFAAQQIFLQHKMFSPYLIWIAEVKVPDISSIGILKSFPASWKHMFSRNVDIIYPGS